MKKWKAILFDMEGTLFDTEQISRIAWLATMERFHLPKSEQFILDLIGRTYQSAQVVFDAYMPKGWPQEEAYQYHEDYAKMCIRDRLNIIISFLPFSNEHTLLAS